MRRAFDSPHPQPLCRRARELRAQVPARRQPEARALVLVELVQQAGFPLEVGVRGCLVAVVPVVHEEQKIDAIGIGGLVLRRDQGETGGLAGRQVTFDQPHIGRTRVEQIDGGELGDARIVREQRDRFVGRGKEGDDGRGSLQTAPSTCALR